MQEVSARRKPGILGFCGLFFTGGQLCAEISALCDKTYCDQCVSKVRSYQGLLAHPFERLAAAMLLLSLNP